MPEAGFHLNPDHFIGHCTNKLTQTRGGVGDVCCATAQPDPGDGDTPPLFATFNWQYAASAVGEGTYWLADPLTLQNRWFGQLDTGETVQLGTLYLEGSPYPYFGEHLQHPGSHFTTETTVVRAVGRLFHLYEEFPNAGTNPAHLPGEPGDIFRIKSGFATMDGLPAGPVVALDSEYSAAPLSAAGNPQASWAYNVTLPLFVPGVPVGSTPGVQLDCEYSRPGQMVDVERSYFNITGVPPNPQPFISGHVVALDGARTSIFDPSIHQVRVDFGPDADWQPNGNQVELLHDIPGWQYTATASEAKITTTNPFVGRNEFKITWAAQAIEATWGPIGGAVSCRYRPSQDGTTGPPQSNQLYRSDWGQWDGVGIRAFSDFPEFNFINPPEPITVEIIPHSLLP